MKSLKSRAPSGVSRRMLLQAAVPALAAAALPAWAQDKPALQRIRERGSLVVGVYNDMPPFNDAGRGIDVALAQALAQRLGVKLSLLPFNAGENMNDDLRNMVWKGHYLGFGPADVLLHVPVDRPLMNENPQVNIFGAYYRERVMVARNLSVAPKMDSLDDLPAGRIAVPGQSLAGWLLIGTDSGKYRDRLTTSWKDGTESAAALWRGEAIAAAGHASELESVLVGDARFAIEPLPLPRMREGWAVGCAVKKGATDLADAVQAAINELATDGTLARLFAAGKVSWRKP
jgi:ABC-type amino acid transport substrate-binding protein